jgi:hypothetical protein
MVDKRRCDICNVEVSKTNWSKHIKTKKHLEAVKAEQSSLGIRDSARREVNVVNERSDGVQIKHCGICNVVVPENEWSEHLKSLSHKKNTKLIKDELKEKVRSFNIRRLSVRNFQDIDFETNDYIAKKSEEALEGCFLTLSITPKN